MYMYGECLCCLPKTGTTLLISYTLILNKKFFLKIKYPHFNKGI